MDPSLIAALLLAALLAAVSTYALRTRRVLVRLGDRVGAPRSSPSAVEEMVGSAIDASVASEQSMSATRAELTALVASLPIGVLRVDEHLVIRDANPAAHAIADRPQGTIVGRSLIEAFVVPGVEEIASAARRHDTAAGEVRLPDPEPRVLLVRARRVGSGDTFVIVQDVSALRRLERIRTEFIDNLSHELRTPLTNVALLGEALARDAVAAGVDQKVRDRIARIEVETGHLVQMVNELLDLARIEGGQVAVPADEVDMAVVARAAVHRMEAFADEQGVELVVDAPDAAPVLGDEGRLAQVLVNLLHNAIKFSQPGRPVIVRVDLADDAVVTSVEDAGIGIRSADQARIFERFYKVDRARVRGGGTGLGLSIAKHIVEAHGGRIGVRSREGRGSTFWVSLPVAGGVVGQGRSSVRATTPANRDGT